MTNTELLASAMRKLLTDENTYAYTRYEYLDYVSWRCDGEAQLTPEEAAVCEEVSRGEG